MRRPRRNSDGTMSFPSQNPYTDRRPDEPKMPKGMEWSMLSKDERERLRGLSKEHAENIGLHILAAFALEESDPELALEHAKWVARSGLPHRLRPRDACVRGLPSGRLQAGPA